MQDLTPVGLNKDGSKLVLISSSGEEFAVPVDTRLRAALRGENARLGQLEMKMESALRPRDIQARIRAGESPEDVAAAAQTTVEAIMGYATPVLAERAHVAQGAMRASVRRRPTESSSAARNLGEASAIYFSDLSLHDRDVEWDAWRRPDGRWALVAEYAVSGRPRRAEFTHDLPGRYVVADNDEARMMTGELRAPESKTAVTREITQTGRRLSSVPSQDELPLGDDAIELVRDHDQARAGSAADATSTPPPVVDPTADTADADWMTADGDAAQQETTEPVAQPETAPVPAPADESPAEPAREAGEAVADEPDAVPAKKKRRSSVPTWDEIMFGGGKSD